VLGQYLDVWDRREGWQGGKYDGRLEKPLRLVAEEVARPPDTVASQYRSAFSLIIGTDYNPLAWLRIVGRSKWPFSKYKGWRNPKGVRQITAVAWSGNIAEVEGGQAQVAVEMRDLVEAVQKLDKEGVNHQEIARRVEIEADFGVDAAEAEIIVKRLLLGDLEL
jgi:hypothetical protein